MAKTGINWVRCNCGSAEAHNMRTEEYIDALNRSEKKTYAIFHDMTYTNLRWVNPEYKSLSLLQVLEMCRKRYRENVGQNTQEEDRVRTITDKKTGMVKTVTNAGWSPIREGVCPVKDSTTPDDFQPFISHLKTKGLHVISIDIHRDEGYQDPVTQERHYNLHAHVIADWTDHTTGKTIKLGKAEMIEMQTVLACALNMERGKTKGDNGPDHLSPEQQREKKARENAAMLEARNLKLEAEIQHHLARKKALKAENALLETSLEEAKKAAHRELLLSNAVDVGARFLNVFGRGVLAEAQKARDEADRRADEAFRQAEVYRIIAEDAEKARKRAEDAKELAEDEARTAKQEKKAYAIKQFEEGIIVGREKGHEDSRSIMDALQRQLAEKQSIIEALDKANKEKVQAAECRAIQAENSIKFMMKINPHMCNLASNIKEMQKAGMKDSDIKKVISYGHIEQVIIPGKNRQKDAVAAVQLQMDDQRVMRVWFNGLRLDEFLKCEQKAYPPKQKY